MLTQTNTSGVLKIFKATTKYFMPISDIGMSIKHALDVEVPNILYRGRLRLDLYRCLFYI